MAEIIDLKDRKKQDLTLKAEQERTKRMEMVLQMFQCSRCAMKCMKCGSQMESTVQGEESPSVPYRFCESCLEEYKEFIERIHGRGDPDYYWYNREWLEVWKAWMQYQESLGRYELSSEFRRLLKELRES